MEEYKASQKCVYVCMYAGMYVWRSQLDYCIGGVLVYPKLLLINSLATSSILGIIRATTWKTVWSIDQRRK